MRNLFKILVALIITVGFLKADQLNQNTQKDGYEIKLNTEKSLIVGTNDIRIELSKDGVDLSDERVIWSNPDDEDQEMKPITPHNVNHH